nr:MAG TPA: hypothetical protein [Caudoviricetes sp.]
MWIISLFIFCKSTYLYRTKRFLRYKKCLHKA